MNLASQRIRAILFYLSLLLFFAGLPLILSSALGYKFNLRNFKFIKTGLIFIKSQPEGAKVYLNDKLINQTTPANIPELKPGVYKINLELAEHYPWKAEVDVEAGRVIRLDKIILFPLVPRLEQLNREKFSSFRVDNERNFIYYLDQLNKVIYKSDFSGNTFEDIASLPEGFFQILGWEISPDAKKLFFFNNYQINIIFFDNQEGSDIPIFVDSREKIINVFWHSDNYHLIVLTDGHIQVVEARGSARPIDLVELSGQKISAYYDSKQDTLYFSDNQNLYRLQLGSNMFSFDRLMSHPFKAITPLKKEKDE